MFMYPTINLYPNLPLKSVKSLPQIGNFSLVLATGATIGKTVSKTLQFYQHYNKNNIHYGEIDIVF